MLANYFITNFMPLMIIIALMAMMYVNRDVKIPATNLFKVVIAIMLVLTVISATNLDPSVDGMTAEQISRTIKIHTLLSTIGYSLRPCLILVEILIILNDKKYKYLTAIPAIINACIFSTALFGSHIAFFIDGENRWHSGPLRSSIYISQIFYLVWLLIISINSFAHKNRRKSIVLFVMVLQAVLVAIMEANAVDPSYTDAITALCIFEYYIFLSTVYRQRLKEQLADYVVEIEEAGLRLEKLTKEVIAAFANSIDAKDKYTHGHSSRVAEYSRRLAQMNGKTKEECDEIYYAGLLHDIGKIGVPENIITKEGKLTAEEYDMIKQHPVLGAQILGSIKEFPYLSVGAKGHHERYDGKGYPYGLKGDEIPEMARIISVADAYDAMSSKRSYRDPIPQQKVREEIVKGTGNQFDPEYARLMLHLIDEDLEYTMSEREENGDFALKDDIIVAENRSVVSDGILLNPFKTTITMSISPTDEAKGAPSPSIILFDSLDGKVHSDEKEVKDLNYFEYGEINKELETTVIGARKMEVKIIDKESSRIRDHGDFIIEGLRIKDHALVRLIGKSQYAEITVALPDNTRFLFLALSGTNCHYQNIHTYKSDAESPEDYIPRIAEEISYINGPVGDVPNVQVDGYRTAHSEGFKIMDGLKISFHAKCLPTARLVWHCPFVDIYGSDTGVVNDYSYRDLAFMRFDGEFWECDPGCSAQLNVEKTPEFQNWDAWKKYNQDGFDAVVTFKVEDNRITIITENAGISVHNVAIMTDVDKDIYAAITGDQVAITNIHTNMPKIIFE